MSRKPVCVCSGDVHFTLQTLELATSVIQQGLALAETLNVPFLINGDLLDSKSIIRGEVANRLIDLLSVDVGVDVIINTGNHDLLSSKGKESSLNFLRPYAQVVSTPTWFDKLGGYVVPYHDSGEELQAFLNMAIPGSRLFVHQGVMGADLGAYLKDSSSLPPEAFANFRVIGSHYHKRQDIKCGRPRKGAVGLFSYAGSGYSVTFSEANDGPKGINILYGDGTLELVPTNLRKHVKLTRSADTVMDPIPGLNPVDLLWVQVTGSQTDLARLDKRAIAAHHGVPSFKFDKIPDEAEALSEDVTKMSNEDVMDKLVDGTTEIADVKAELKALWREVLS